METLSGLDVNVESDFIEIGILVIQSKYFYSTVSLQEFVIRFSL